METVSAIGAVVGVEDKLQKYITNSPSPRFLPRSSIPSETLLDPSKIWQGGDYNVILLFRLQSIDGWKKNKYY